jgi:hypothetical protein
MKIKEYLKDLTHNHITLIKGLVGEQLIALEPYFDNIEELKDKNITIIDPLNQNENDPLLINVKGFDDLKKDIQLYSIYLEGDDVFVRCTVNSLKGDFEIIN